MLIVIISIVVCVIGFAIWCGREIIKQAKDYKEE